jgi:hypothetical protein
MARTSSQNVLFHGASPGDDRFEPPGRTIAKKLLEHLRAENFVAADEDNWRDGGWSIDVSVKDCVLQVAIAQAGETDTWIAQVAPLSEPGMIAQLFGRKFVDRTSEVLAVSRAIDGGLRQAGHTGILWCLDGFPDEASGTPEPIDPRTRAK